jgi:hypothetical protein
MRWELWRWGLADIGRDAEGVFEGVEGRVVDCDCCMLVQFEKWTN